MKHFRKLLFLALVFAASLAVFCACSPQDEIEVKIHKIEVTAYPLQYYVTGDKISLENGQITAYYKDGTQKTVLFTDGAVSVEYAGTAVSDVTNVMRIKFDGAETTMLYYVGTKRISGITLEGLTEQRYSAGQSPLLKGGKIVTAFADGSQSEFYLTSSNSGTYNESYLKNKKVTLSGFDTTKSGEFSFAVMYRASEFKVDYKVESKPWITDVQILENKMRTSYFAGEQMELNSTNFDVFYNDGTVKNFAVKAEYISGFSTESVGNFEMTVKYPLFEREFKVDYTVYADADIAKIEYDLSSEKSFEIGDIVELSGTNIIVVFNDGKTVVKKATDKEITVTASETRDGEQKPYREVVSSSKGRQYFFRAAYRGHLSDIFVIEVIKRRTEVKVFDADTIRKTYTADEVAADGFTFDFGTAYAVEYYNDGTESNKLYLSEQYALDLDARTVGFMDAKYKDVLAFDMTKGEHTYFIRNTKYENGSYYKISYTVVD